MHTPSRAPQPHGAPSASPHAITLEQGTAGRMAEPPPTPQPPATLATPDEKSRAAAEQGVPHAEKKLRLEGPPVQMLEEKVKQCLLRLKEDNAEYFAYVESMPDTRSHGLRTTLLSMRVAQERNTMRLAPLFYLDASISPDKKSSLCITLNRNGTITLGKNDYQVCQ